PSPMVIAIGEVGVSSGVVWSAMDAMTGKSLTGFTVSRNDVLAFVVPSLTVRVIVVVPNWFVAGVIITPRLVPPPPNTMLLFGTKVGLLELPVTFSALAGVSMSLTLKVMSGVGVSSLIVTGPFVEIVGASFSAFTVTTKLVVVAPKAASTTLI